MDRSWWIVIYVVITGKAVWCQDPCDTANHQEFPTNEIGSRNEICTASNPRDICDYYLQDGWYTVSQGIMLNRCPVEGTCGVAYPVWVKGEFPTEGGGIVEASACISMNGDCCAENLTISVKNCSAFMVYNLKSLPFCTSVYCIETMLTCDGKPIETIESTQPMTSTFPTTTSTPATKPAGMTKPTPPNIGQRRSIPCSDDSGFGKGIAVGVGVSIVLWLATAGAIIIIKLRQKPPVADDAKKAPTDLYLTCQIVEEDKQPYDYIKM